MTRADDCAFIVSISLASALFSEFVSWVLIYRTDHYKQLKGKIEVSSKKLEVTPIPRTVLHDPHLHRFPPVTPRPPRKGSQEQAHDGGQAEDCQEA